MQCETVEGGSSDTASLHTANAVISTLSMLSTTFQLSEQSASLEENITKMEEFISTLSSTLDGSLEAEMSAASMLTVATRTYLLLQVHLKLAGTMRLRMATLLLAGFSDQATELATKRNGQRSSQREMLKNFGDFVRVWLREHSCVISTPYEHIAIGGISPSLLDMNTQEEYKSTRERCLNSINGYEKTLIIP